MQNTTLGFDSEIVTQTKARETIAKIVFTVEDVTAKPDVTPTATSTESISDVEYAVDTNLTVDKNYATFETNRWSLGGGFQLLSSSAPYSSMGWWSDALSSTVAKTFTPNITFTCTFTTNHSSLGITINWDTTNNEYAEDFAVVFYDSGDNIIEFFSVSGNTKAIYSNSTAVNNYRKIEIVISKWCLGDRRARIEEIIFGIIETFTRNSKLITCKVVEQIDITSATIPANQLNFVVDNQDQTYNILNPTGIYSYLQEQQKIEVYMGCNLSGVEEYKNMGTFYLDDWKTEENRLTATFTGLDRLNLLNARTYYKGLSQSISLYDLAEDVLLDFGLTSLDYNIDTALQSITMTNFLPICTYREALQKIAIAGECVLYVDRNNKIQIVRPTVINSGKDITFLNSYNVPKIELDKVIKQIDVKLYNYISSADTTDIFSGTIYINGSSTIWITYDSPATNVSATVDTGSITSATYYTNACLLSITSTGDTIINVTGKVITVSSNPISSTIASDGSVITVDSQLITSSLRALSVATWVNTELQKRKLFTSTWRGNPAFELTDIIGIENQFATYNDTRIIEQEYEYTGALKCNTKTRG